MKIFKLVFFVFKFIVLTTFKLTWGIFLFFIHLVDGGNTDYSSNDNNYNYRTGEHDPVNRSDGIYDNHR